MRFKLTIKRFERPYSNEFDEEFRYLCKALGFFEPIDKDKTASKIFKEILLSTQKGRGVSSTELSNSLEMSRGAVINQLNNLLDAGLVMKQGRDYIARSKSMFRLMDELERDVDRVFEELKFSAKDLDNRLTGNSKDISKNLPVSVQSDGLREQAHIHPENRTGQRKHYNVEVQDVLEETLKVFVKRKEIDEQGNIPVIIINEAGQRFATKLPASLTNQRIQKLVLSKLNSNAQLSSNSDLERFR